MSDSGKSNGNDPGATAAKDSSLDEQKSANDSLLSLRHADNVLLAELGYKAEFRREFSVSTHKA